MKRFFKVKTLEAVLELTERFSPVAKREIPVGDVCGRILAQNILASQDLPGFRRSTMDGYAVDASSTFGASESNPAWLEIKGTILMGDCPDFEIGPGEAAQISTGGMLPKGADAVVMVEHTQSVDDTSVEVYKSVAPLQYVIDRSEDYARDEIALKQGILIRPQEQGLMAGLGIETVPVFDRPKIGIISTGDEIVPIDQPIQPGRIRDINSYTLSGYIEDAGAVPIRYGIVNDDPAHLKTIVEKAVSETDMVMISGGSSVGAKDYTIEVLEDLPDTQVLVHGISISPGKPTIIAKSGNKPVWGLPGQVTSAMVVVKMIVIPFLERLKGCKELSFPERLTRIPAILNRNLSSTQGRRDFVRVRLNKENDQMTATPVLGKSGLIRTMVHADGLLEIMDDVEGLEKDTRVKIIPI